MNERCIYIYIYIYDTQARDSVEATRTHTQAWLIADKCKQRKARTRAQMLRVETKLPSEYCVLITAVSSSKNLLLLLNPNTWFGTDGFAIVYAMS